uniref:uncharacterized protein ddias n=1 Tax=Centroberyx gerrardi TaxID=166262 RepID=UPI003AACDC9A
MPVRRALVDCAVLSLQDACVFYPYCRGCFSRIDVQQQDTTRCRCSKCGYSCLKERVDYRYRLSLRVARDSHIFGVTVFGTCLDPFFGIHASGLQRLVQDSDLPVEAPTRSKLLVKAVEDCFIGRHFIFGIKVTATETGPLLERPVPNGSTSKDTAQFIASQIILPKAAALGGCTLISYYRILLQKAAEYPLGSTDPSKTSGPPATSLLLIPHHSPASSFNNTTLPASCLLSQSPQRSRHQDCTLSPTPPWQQSLGLVTSSAEQEEGCSTQDSGNENDRQTHNKRPPHHTPVWQRGCWEKHEVTLERAPSPLPSLYESSSCNSQSFTKCTDSSIQNANGNSPTLHTWSSPSQPGHSRILPLSPREKGLSEREQTKSSLSSSVAWEDLPFSESLAAFLCEGDEVFDTFSETEPNVIAPNQKETSRSDTSVGQSHDKNSSNESVSLCQSINPLTDTHSYKRILQDVINTAAVSYGDDVTLDLPDQTDRDPGGCENRWQTSNVCSHECEQEDEEAGSVSFNKCKDEEEKPVEDVYDCSADLFSSSLMNTETLTTHAETDSKMPVQYLYTPDKQGLNSNKGIHIDSGGNSQSPGTQDLNSDKKATIDMIQCDYSQSLDFIPPSQSTPIVKVAVVAGLPASTHRTSTLGEFSLQPDRRDSYAFHLSTPGWDSEKLTKITSSLCQLNSFSANQLHQCGRVCAEENLVCSTTPSRRRRSRSLAPKRSFWKLDEPRHCLLAQQHLRLQRGSAVNRGSTGRRTNHKCDTSVCDVSVCDYEDNEITGPPKTRLPVKPRRRGHNDNCDGGFGYDRKGQQTDGVKCKRTLLDQTSQTHVAQRQTGNGVCSQPCGSERAGSSKNTSVDEVSPDGSDSHSLHDEDEACDWSKDLFSDSL